MALVGMSVRLSASNPMRQFGAASAGTICKCTWSGAGALRSAARGGEADIQNVTDRSAIPNGALHPTSWVLPTNAGGMASYRTLSGSGDVSAANLASGANIIAELAGAGDMQTSNLALLLYAACTVSGSGDVSDANLAGVLEAVAALSGSGDVAGVLSALVGISASLSGAGNVSAAELILVISASASLTGGGTISDANLALAVFTIAALVGSGGVTAGITGALEAAASLVGSGDLAGAASALGHLAATMEGAGDMSATPYAVGTMSADIRAYGDLTPQGLAGAVWGALAAANNDAGSMGELLNASGASGNPWLIALEGSYTAADLLRILASALAGNATVPSGAGAFAFRDLSDTKDRLVGTIDSNGARDVTDIDGS